MNAPMAQTMTEMDCLIVETQTVPVPPSVPLDEEPAEDSSLLQMKQSWMIPCRMEMWMGTHRMLTQIQPMHP